MEDSDRYMNLGQIREDIREEVRREMHEELTMRELGKTLPSSVFSPATSIYTTPAAPTHHLHTTHTSPLTPPKLNTSPTRYRTVMHSPAPSPPTLYTSPPHAQSVRNRSPVRAANGNAISVHADLARPQPKFETDYLNWRHKSPSRYLLFHNPSHLFIILIIINFQRKTTLEEVERDLEQLRRKHQQQLQSQQQRQQQQIYQPTRSTLPSQKSPNPFSITNSHAPNFYGMLSRFIYLY